MLDADLVDGVHLPSPGQKLGDLLWPVIILMITGHVPDVDEPLRFLFCNIGTRNRRQNCETKTVMSQDMGDGSVSGHR